MPKTPPDFRQIAAETTEALTSLRQRLRAILDALLPESYGARSLGRSLGIGQTTAWRCWHIARVADPARALAEIPGRRAWEEIFDGLARLGAPPQEIESLREAFRRIEPLVFGRRANRITLQAIAGGGLDSAGDLAALRELRRSMSRGHARLYGLQARAVAVAWLIAPGPAKGGLGLGVAGGMEGLRRMRPGPPWPLLQRSVGRPPGGAGTRSYDPLGDDPLLPTLIRAASSRGIAGVELRGGSRHGSETIELADVPEDRQGRLHFCHAEHWPSVGSLAPREVLPVVLATPVLLPAEMLVFDVCVHRALVRHTEPTASLHGSPVTIERLSSLADSIRFPFEASMVAVRSPRLPARCKELRDGHLEAIRRVAEAQRWSVADYAIHRLVLAHPPLFSSVVGSFELIGAG